MTLLRYLTSSVLALSFGTPALADKFHFSKPDAPPMEARILEGVLLEETDLAYRIRVEGGELTIPKALVQKVEKDGLTVAQLEQREKDAREMLAQANQDRRAALRAESAAMDLMRASAQAAEASMARADARVEEATATSSAVVFDPVIGRSYAIGSVVENEIRRELGGQVRRVIQRQLRVVRRELRRMFRFAGR